MTHFRTTSPNRLRAILCFRFNHEASFGEIADFKRSVLADSRVRHCVDVTGTFDFMLEAEHPDPSSHQSMVESLAARFDHVIQDHESNLVCRRYIRERPRDGHFWVPNGDGLQRIDHGRLEKVAVEGDYVRLHADGQSWLLHLTLKKVREQLDQRRFLQINRSTIVRADLISQLIRKNRRWVARLPDGSEHSVAQSRSAEVIARLKSDFAVRGPVSAATAANGG